MLEIISKYHEGLLTGLGVTLRLCAIVWGAGLVIGGALGAAAVRLPDSIGLFSRVISFILAGTPILVLLFWLHYPAQALAGVVIDPFFTAAAALSLMNTFAVADCVRDGLRNLPKEYVVAARVCGLSVGRIVRHIQLPLLLRHIAPTLLMIQVNMLQATLFASLISVDEIFRIAQRINATEYRPVEVYTALAAFFLLICLPLNGAAMMLRRRFRHDLSER